MAAVLIVATLPAGTGCAHWRQPRAAAAATPTAPQPVTIGTIALVDEPGKFVLIDSGSLAAPPVGVILKTYSGEMESGELITSQVRKHPFSVADIRSGQPHKGDRVKLPSTVATPGTVAPPVAAAPVPSTP